MSNSTPPVKMVKLPVDLFDIIASFSGPDDLILLSTVSRAWQSVIERRTMRTIHIKSTDLQNFSNIFAHYDRRAALINLSYDVVLPAYSDGQCASFETDMDKQRNNEALTDAVHSLFSILHSWDEDDGMLSNGTTDYQRPVVVGRISLTLNAHSPSDVDRREHVDVTARANGRKNLFERRYKRSFLRISRCDELPALSRIRNFQAEDLCHRRRIEGASLAGIAAKLPHLETITWAVNDDEKANDFIRQRHRFEFAQSLAALPLHSLKRVDLTIFNQATHIQHLQNASALLSAAPWTDHLSLALHALSLSPNLTHLSLRGDIVLSPCFFWPQDPTTSTPFWPHLQYLIVWLNITTPEGNWLNVRDPEDADDDNDDEESDVDEDYDGSEANDDDEDDDDEDDYDEDVNPFTHSDLLELAQFLGMQTGNENELTDESDSEASQSFDESLQLRFAGSEPEHCVRKVIDGGRLNPMLCAMARAARHMPSMRRLGLHLNTGHLRTADLWFLARGGRPGMEYAELFEENAEGEKVSRWSVPEDLQAAWEIVDAEDEDDVLVEDKQHPIYVHTGVRQED